MQLSAYNKYALFIMDIAKTSLDPIINLNINTKKIIAIYMHGVYAYV